MGRQITSIFLLIVSFGLTSCYYDKADKLYPSNGGACDTTNSQYTSDVKPIIKTNCLDQGCHTSSNPSGLIVLETYSGVQSMVSGDRLMNAIKQTYPTGSTKNMPPAANKISDCEINKIQSWINHGAQNN